MSLDFIQPTAPGELSRFEDDQESLAYRVNVRLTNVEHGEPGHFRKITPVIGVNYNEETITYMQHPHAANKIIDIVISQYKAVVEQERRNGRTQPRKLVIISPTAGIGGDMMVALDRKEVSLAIGYEMDPDRRDMLINNLQAYGYNPDRYCVAVTTGANGQESGEFKGIPYFYTPEASPNEYFTVLMMDPAWLNSALSGQYVHAENYLLKGATICGIDIEEWVMRSFRADLITIYVPIGYKLDRKLVEIFGQSFIRVDGTIDGVEYIYDKMSDGNNAGKEVNYARVNIPALSGKAHADLFLLRPVKANDGQSYGPLTFLDKFYGEPIHSATEGASYRIIQLEIWQRHVYKPNCQVKAVKTIKRQDTEYKSEELSSILDVIEPPVLTDLRIRGVKEARRAAKNTDPQILLQWVNGLVTFLKSLLRKIFGDNYADLLLNKKTIPIWIKTFTHQDVDPVNNYETLEFMGDKTLGSAFALYMLRNIPDVTNDFMTNLDHVYMSSLKQPDYARHLGLVPWMRIQTYYPIPNKVVGDAFEAFSGAIAVIANEQDMDGYSGLGHSLVERLLEYIFSMEEFKVDPDYGKTTLENRLPQMFQKIHLKSDSANGKWDKKLAESD